MTDRDVIDFIHATLRSVWALELLLLLKRHPERAWLEVDLIRELRGSQVAVRGALSELGTAGLILQEDGAARYQPATSALDDAVRALEALYAARPMAVVRAVTSAPNQKLRIFSDAFKWKDS